LITRSALRLKVAEAVWSESEYELRKCITLMTLRGTLTTDIAESILAEALTTVADRIAQIPEAVYDSRETVARIRVPRDPDDWHTVALALVTGADIWTADAD